MQDLIKIKEDSKHLTLLYVEDDKEIREKTGAIFEMLFHKVIFAVDGNDGLHKLQDNNIDLIITDINMPNLNGLDMCKEIRKIDNDIAIVIISAHSEYSFFLDSIDLGINGYLFKPLSTKQLALVLKRIVQRTKYLYEAKKNLHFLKIYKEASNFSSIVTKTDLKGIITYANDAFCEISGYSRAELIGKNHNIVRHPDNQKEIYDDIWKTISQDRKVWQGMLRNKTKDSKSYYVDSTIIPIIDQNGKTIEYISLRHDVTDIMNPSKQLKSAIKDFEKPILIYMKLDKFDMIEEFYDSKTIEKIQEKTTKHLQKRFSNIYDFDMLYVLDNGEYALLLDYNKYFITKELFVEKLQKLQDLIREDMISLDYINYDIAVSISVVYEKNKMLESAKLGIRKLLKDRKDFLVANNLADYIQMKALKNLKTVSMIQTALDNDKIISYFQPIVDNKTLEISKYESLVRLVDENGTVKTPFFFLDTAKKSSHYAQITKRVLNNAFFVLKQYNINITINLSALDIEQKTTRENILNLLDEYSSYGSKIVFELLEDESVKEFEVIKQFISDVKSYGVRIAIDDFGAGYSNYERLLDYQPDILKIDGCLIKNIQTSSYSKSVVKSIVTFAKEQNIQTVAEFIENEEIFKIVKELGVDYSQGYYFNKPEPITHYVTS